MYDGETEADMAWDFSTEPEFQEKLDWVERFCKEKVEPLDYVFPYAVRSPDPVVKAYVRELQQEVKDQGLWAIFLDEELEVVAGGDVAYAQALLRCGTPDELAKDPELRLRLTLGLHKEGDRWVVAHEHHSVPDRS